MALVVVTCAVFGRSLDDGFQDLDDRVNVADNPRLAPVTAAHVWEFWSEPYLSLYIPVTYTWFAAEALVAERAPPPGERLDPRVFHAGNLLLHSAGVLLLYFILVRLTAHHLAAFAGALLYAVHPLHVESAAWITETKGLLSSLLALAALVCALNFVERPARSVPWAVGGGGLFLLAMLAKPTAVTVPLITWVILWAWRPAQLTRGSWLVAAWLAAVPLIILMTRAQQPAEAIDERPLLGERVLVALDSLAFYAQKFAIPWPLCPDYGRTPGVALQSPARWLRALVPLVILALAAALPQRRYLLAGVAVYFLALLPTSGLIPFGFQNISTVADRYACLALFGPALIVAALVACAPGPLVVIGCLVWIAALAAVSVVQTGYWRDTPTLFDHTLRVNPRSWLAHEKLAAHARRLGQPQMAVEHFQAAVTVAPGRADLHNKLGDALFRVGHLEQAEAAFRRAIDLNDGLKEPHCNLGTVLYQRGRLAEALAEFDRALQIDPNYAIAREKRQIVAARLNKYPP